MTNTRLKKILILTLGVFFYTSFVVSAQLQDFNFSGSNAESYQCFDRRGNQLMVPIEYSNAVGFFYCNINGVSGYQPCEDGIFDPEGPDCDIRAVIKPPALQQLEIWFVRIVYTIWAISASLSFLLLVALGYQYLISRGDPTQIKAIRERIVKFFIGFILVFLAVPILTTVFRLLGVNDAVQCYSGLVSDAGIGFQFVFPDLCTDPEGDFADELLANPCNVSLTEAEGRLCSPIGSGDACVTAGYRFVCVEISGGGPDGIGIWEVRSI
jgi:hypothetical protein